jgi:hypothetical protein
MRQGEKAQGSTTSLATGRKEMPPSDYLATLVERTMRSSADDAERTKGPRSNSRRSILYVHGRGKRRVRLRFLAVDVAERLCPV